jgi:hypothetical protein
MDGYGGDFAVDDQLVPVDNGQDDASGQRIG